jgi:hypothetical protein
MRGREYDASVFRFAQIDPAALPTAVAFEGPYGYVSGRPGVLIDPTGLCWVCSDPGGIVSGTEDAVSSTASTLGDAGSSAYDATTSTVSAAAGYAYDTTASGVEWAADHPTEAWSYASVGLVFVPGGAEVVAAVDLSIAAYEASQGNYTQAALFALPAGLGAGAKGIKAACNLVNEARAAARTKAAGGLMQRLSKTLGDETGSIGNPFARRAGRAPEYYGGTVTEDQALSTAERWLRPGYREVESGSGRYLSANGERGVRYGSDEVTDAIHHIHYEAYENGYVVENTFAHIVP